MSFSIPTLRSSSKRISTSSAWDWSTFCTEWDMSSPVFSMYGWIINGLDMGSNAFPNTSTLTINFKDDIKQLVSQYGATVTYSISGNGPGTSCDFGPLTGNILYGMSDISLVYSSVVPSCGLDGTDLQMTINVSGLDTTWWNNICCPMGHCALNG